MTLHNVVVAVWLQRQAVWHVNVSGSVPCRWLWVFVKFRLKIIKIFFCRQTIKIWPKKKHINWLKTLKLKSVYQAKLALLLSNLLSKFHSKITGWYRTRAKYNFVIKTKMFAWDCLSTPLFCMCCKPEIVLKVKNKKFRPLATLTKHGN